MKIKLSSFLLASCLLISSFSKCLAEDEIDCGPATTQRDITLCAESEADKANKEINALWALVKEHVQNYDGPPSFAKGYRKALLVSQRAWLKFRKAQCDWSAYEYDRGTNEKMVKAFCIASLTRERIKFFKDYLKEEKEKNFPR